jgi:hypothetical protein
MLIWSSGLRRVSSLDAMWRDGVLNYVTHGHFHRNHSSGLKIHSTLPWARVQIPQSAFCFYFYTIIFLFGLPVELFFFVVRATRETFLVGDECSSIRCKAKKGGKYR